MNITSDTTVVDLLIETRHFLQREGYSNSAGYGDKGVGYCIEGALRAVHHRDPALDSREPLFVAARKALTAQIPQHYKQNPVLPHLWYFSDDQGSLAPVLEFLDLVIESEQAKAERNQ